MPIELPGFYFDKERNRYFPLSSKPPSSQSIRPPSTSDSDDFGQIKQSPKVSSWNVAEIARTSHSSSKRHQASHDLLGRQYSNPKRFLERDIPIFGRMKSFLTMSLDGALYRFIGDSRGWLFSCTPPSNNIWQADINLHAESEVSSISASGSRCVATSFGPAAKLAIQDLHIPGYAVLISDREEVVEKKLQENIPNKWAAKKAVYMNDVDVLSIKDLETKSDVFAVRQHNNMIFTGCRNGSILRFDKRLDYHGQKLYNDRFLNQQRTSVLHLETIADWQLLISHMNGDLMIFDLRFPRENSPLVQFRGHRNTYTQKLGIALDPSQEFLFAAGEDRQIRGWSVQSGQLLTPPYEQQNTDNPFAQTFPSVIETMQISSEPEGLCLWAGHDRTLYQVFWGRQ
ncbi:hypothetical protein H0H93_008592 [Arthromyces matolae]|nr:hypothetical protein H0H93_008592 [Arthromyces matolae]